MAQAPDQLSTADPIKSITTSVWKIVPHFPSTSISQSILFYTTALHFALGGSTPTFCSVFIGKQAAANIYLYFHEFSAPTSSPPDPTGNVLHPGAVHIAMGTAELEQYYELLKKEGTVSIVKEI
ncbi:hypothetical protein FRB95_014293 [Tulasnella sp. JGI-2019a]|nr:hypothetical protein FRB95_014293 [Tulasnella sp. JGI-2019a]